jgi:glycosyltransferase involved in cell wall biosynthesis
LELFSPRDGAAARAELNLPGDAPVVMFVGGFQPWHGLEHLLDAFAQVQAARPDARLVLVGDGPAREAVTRQARALRLNGCLHITGSVPHARVPQLLAAADVVAAPYPRLPREMWFSPLKLYEYMAAGKAIVATDDGQIRQAIQDGENGLLVPPGDVSSLAAAITQLVQDPARRAQLGQTARCHAVERHSWERHIDRLIEVYRTVL